MEYLTVSEVAERLRVSTRTVRERIKAGKLEAFKNGARWLIPATEIERFLEGKKPFVCALDKTLCPLIEKEVCPFKSISEGTLDAEKFQTCVMAHSEGRDLFVRVEHGDMEYRIDKLNLYYLKGFWFSRYSEVNWQGVDNVESVFHITKSKPSERTWLEDIRKGVIIL